MAAPLFSFDYEVHGKVQGVFFRKNTKIAADQHRVRGTVRNTDRGTVEGTAQGTKEALEKMKHWLTHVGSKRSKISGCDIRNERRIEEFEFTGFTVIK